MASNILLLKGNASESPLMNSIIYFSSVSATFFLAIESIPSDKSNPIIFVAEVFSANLIAKSPVPVAISRMLSG